MFSLSAQAQNTSPLPATGNVGIGTSSPAGLLHLNGTDGFNVQDCHYEDNTTFRIDYHMDPRTMECEGYFDRDGNWHGGTTGTRADIVKILKHNPFGYPSSSRYVMHINTLGHIGLGTEANSDFTVNVDRSALINRNLHIRRKLRINSSNLTLSDFNNSHPYTFSVDQGDSRFDGNIELHGELTLIGGNNSSVGTNEIKLYSNGYIRAREVQVDFNMIPDYVFQPDYQLMPLSDVDAYISEHGHLPNVKSEEEIIEDGAYSLGEMNKKLLEKIEELTLYIIQQQREIDAIKVQMDSNDSDNSKKD